MDSVNQWGRTKDVVVVGSGNSTLDDVLADAAPRKGRTVDPGPGAGKGLLLPVRPFRVREAGRAALYTDSGVEYIGKPGVMASRSATNTRRTTITR